MPGGQIMINNASEEKKKALTSLFVCSFILVHLFYLLQSKQKIMCVKRIVSIIFITSCEWRVKISQQTNKQKKIEKFFCFYLCIYPLVRLYVRKLLLFCWFSSIFCFFFFDWTVGGASNIFFLLITDFVLENVWRRRQEAIIIVTINRFLMCWHTKVHD